MSFVVSINEPERLTGQVFKFIVRNLDQVFDNPMKLGYELEPGHVLPREICEALIAEYQKNGFQVDDKFVNLFRDRDRTKLNYVRLRNASLTDAGFRMLLKHRLVELDIAKCVGITDQSLNDLNEHSDRLVSLTIGPGVNLLPDNILFTAIPSTFAAFVSQKVKNYEEKGYILKAPNLRKLAIKDLYVHRERKYFPLLLSTLTNLTELDLSGCSDIENMEFIAKLTNLTSLILHNVSRVEKSVNYICQLKNLRHLDISQSSDKFCTVPKENETLAYIVEQLPNLTSLDISGTNLAGTGVAEKSKECNTKTDIPGLSSRVGRPLEFLGLYGTLYAACSRHDIPAKNISGDANEKQILVAAAAYLERPEVLQKVLNDLYQLFRYENCQDIKTALAIVLEAMDRHVTSKHIQISGSATLFYIVKNREMPPLSSRIKQAIFTTLLNGMNMHRNDETMMRNGCLTLCQFKIPSDVHEYKRLINILLHIVSEMDQEGFVQRIGIYLLNTLACQVEGSQKQVLGDLGAISKMFYIINNRVARKSCDDVLEVAWSTMWNVTDETPINCQRFLDGKGMSYFLSCLTLFPDKDELMRNMMGLLGNVAEVKELRPRLMTAKYICVFADLIDSTSDGIEVSYNAAGVLSHIASDGPEAWTISEPSRETVLARMVTAIDRWPLNSLRNINYRSFEPILHLAKIFHTPECQHWAVWALANLTRVYPEKYCLLVEAENGLVILDNLIMSPHPYPRIKELAHTVIQICMKNRNGVEEDQMTELQLDG